MQPCRRNYVANGLVTHNSHAVSYAIITYMTAWLKVNYPVEFLTALLTNYANDDDKLTLYLTEISRMKIKTLDPNINLSTDEFSYRKNKIIFPLNIVKNVGVKALENILSEREKNGRYKSFDNFLNRINKRHVNLRVINSLIFANAFRKFGKVDALYNHYNGLTRPDKYTIRQLYCGACKKRYPVNIKASVAEDNGLVCPQCGDVDIISEETICNRKRFDLAFCRKQVFGFVYGDFLKPYYGDFIEYDAKLLSEVGERERFIKVGALVKNIKKFKDKNGNEMAFMKLTDGKVEKRLVVFSKYWDAVKDRVVVGDVCIFKVKQDDESLILQGGLTKLMIKG